MKRPLFPAKGLTRQAEGTRDAVLELIGKADRTWGHDRLRLLVSDEMRDRWDRQLMKFEAALRSSMAGDIRRHAEGVRKGLQLMAAAAIEAGHEPLDPTVWTVELSDGTAIAIVQGQVENLHVCDDFPEVYTLVEIGRLIEARPDLRMMKRGFPGAEITGVAAREPIDWETGDSVEDLGQNASNAA